MASEFRGVAVAPGTSGTGQSAVNADGGNGGSDAHAFAAQLPDDSGGIDERILGMQRCPPDGGVAEAAQALKVKLERKVNDGTASDQEITTLVTICGCVGDRPCMQWANVIKNEGLE